MSLTPDAKSQKRSQGMCLLPGVDQETHGAGFYNGKQKPRIPLYQDRTQWGRGKFQKEIRLQLVRGKQGECEPPLFNQNNAYSAWRKLIHSFTHSTNIQGQAVGSLYATIPNVTSKHCGLKRRQSGKSQKMRWHMSWIRHQEGQGFSERPGQVCTREGQGNSLCIGSGS